MCTVSGSAISLSGLTPTPTPSFQISQLRSPYNDRASSFIVITYNIVGAVFYAMDTINTGLLFEADCTLPCRTCSAPTQCLSCYSSSSVSNAPYLTTVAPWCVTSCGTYYYQNAVTLTCTPCNSNCQSCDSALECSLCDSGYFIQNNVCVA